MSHTKLRYRNMELWEILSEENDRYHARMDSYESLPEEERLEKYREEIRTAEAKIIEIIDVKNDGSLLKAGDSIDDMDTIEHYLGNRYYALSKMFAIHCSDAEVKRIEEQNAHLLELSNDMYSRTGKMFRYMVAMPLEEKDDDIEVEGTLRYWGDDEQDVLRLEDDEFYASDFMRMIPVIEFIEREHHGDLAIMECFPSWRKGDGLDYASMTDEQLDVVNTLDDGQTWAESWLRHPKLDHIVMCYATHAVDTHYDYSIVDFMRMNTFEVKVNVKLQQICEQDGTRLWWWERCSEQQFREKFLHEAEHRPVGMSKGEFLWKRITEYFSFEERDEDEREVLRHNQELNERRPGSRIELDPANFRADRMASLPDCRQDDSLVDEFLKVAYRIAKEI